MKLARLVVASTLLTAGCVGSLPTTHYYTLRPPTELETERTQAAGEGLVIAVEELAVASPYDQDRLVYRRDLGSTEVGFYNYHRWAAPLGRLAAEALTDGLRGVPGIGSIEPTRSSTASTARLGGRILYFEGIESAGTARVALELELRDAAGESLWSERIAARDDGAFADGAELGERLTAALELALEQVRTSLATALAPAPQSGE